MSKIINKNYIFSLLILICFNSAFASENITQFIVEADKSIEYFEKQKIYVASGNAKASKGNFSISAEKITAFLGNTKNANMVHRGCHQNISQKIDSRCKQRCGWNWNLPLLKIRDLPTSVEPNNLPILIPF